ncbi:DUF721 domain-containing protein [bacterium]|nr:DUF721 domain-containing protein [bacterium]
MASTSSSFKRVPYVIDEILKDLRPPEESYLAAVRERWSEIVGDTVAAHTEPVMLQSGVLTVAVRSHVWQNELHSHATTIGAKLRQNVYSGIRVIRFIVQSQPSKLHK